MVETALTGSAKRILGVVAIASSACLLTAAGVWAQVPTDRSFNPVTSYTAETLLRKAAEQAKQEQWAEALDLYQKVIALPGESNAKIPKDDPMAEPGGLSELVVDARQHAQTRIASLPPDALALYRSRVDVQAERLFVQGAADHDRALLRRVVDGLFASSWGDDAIEALGDLAFQDGQFAEALGLYRRLVPDRGGISSGMAYPDPGVDLARVAAKKLLCRAALGTDPPAPDDLTAYANDYPDAKGSIAGREGTLSKSLADAIRGDHLAIPPQSDGRWPTFAGAMNRSRVALGPIDIGQFQWRRKLEAPAPPRQPPPMTRFGGGFQPMVAPIVLESGLAFHPIVLGDQVIVCDEGKIQAFHLNARDPGADPAAPGAVISEDVFAWDQKLRSQYAPPSAPRAGSGGSQRYTLTAHGDRIFARLGGTGSGGGTLIAVRNNRDVEGKRLWEKPCTDISLPRARADAPGRISGAIYEGTPVADSRNVYIGLTEGGAEVSVYVACLDAETGATRWVKHLGTATSPENVQMLMNGMGGMINSAGAGNRLLSLDGQTVYYQTNLGSVAALDAETGAIRWLASYPTREGNGARPMREANPAVIHDGLVIIAPDDALPIFAFDASTGKTVWKTPPMEKVSHLLGVAKGRLIATGDRVYSFDLKTGKLIHYWPDGPSGFEGHGRGLLAGDSIYWPTKTDIFVLDQATGTPGDREPIHLMRDYGTGGGNLAAGDGYLVIAQRDALVVFAQNSRLIDRFREEIAKNPNRAASYFGLARVAEATGQEEVALENLEETIRRAKPSDTIDDQPLGEEALAKQYKLLVRLANKAAAAKDFAGEVKRYEAAVKIARNDRDRLAARLHLASAQTKAGDPKAAVASLQAVLDDPKLRAQTVTYDDRWTVRADLWIADKLQTMLKENGASLYAEYDKKAEEMLDRGRKDGSARDLEEVGHAYPAAKVVPEALLTLGALREAQEKPAEAAKAYKRLASLTTSDAIQAKALLGLARAYQTQGLILPARDTLTRAQTKFADLRLDDSGTVGSIVTEKLAQPPFQAMLAGRAEPSLPVPLRRVWEKSFGAHVRPIAADGIPPSLASPRVFLVERTSVRPIEPASGESSWKAEIGAEPSWVGYVGDRLIAASATGIVGLDGAKGTVKWRYPEEESRAAKAVANPFATPAGAARAIAKEDGPLGRLHGFRVAGGRVFCQRGDRELLTLDGETGGVEWTYSPASGSINPNLSVGSRKIVLQLLEPEALVVLEVETGRRREFPLAVDRGEPASDKNVRGWERPPVPIDEDHVAVAVDPRTVALLDLNTGQKTWTSRVTSAALPRHGPPRLLGDASRLLVLYEGNELIRLDAANGRQLWTRALGLEDLSDFPDALAMDADRFYCATGATLAAYNLADGQPLWSRPLTGPKVGWSVALSDRHVTVYPSPSRSLDGPLNGVSLVVCRRDTGALVQRLSFPATASDLAVRLLPEGAIVATQASAWALGEAKVVDGPRPPR